MADYYPLLAKAVAGLADQTPHARNAIYDRAREALLRQLHDLEPPVPEDAIEREAHALEVAVAQIETEIASRSVEIDFPFPEWDIEDLAPPARAQPRPQGNGPADAPASRASPRGGDMFGRGTFAAGRAENVPPPPLDVRREPKRPVGKTSPGEPAPPRPTLPDFDQGNTFSLKASPPGPQALEAPPYEELAREGVQPDPASPQGRPWIEAYHSFVAREEAGTGRSRRLVVLGAGIALLVLAIAITAYRLRDRPEDLMTAEAPPVTAQGEAGGGAKIAERISGGEEPADSQSSPADGQAAAGARPNLPIAVPLRAALLVEAPEEQAKVRTFRGTVLWRIQNVSNGPDEPLRAAVKAEIDIPEEKIQATMTMQKNFDGTLPASHTMKLVFSVPPDSLLGNIKQISAVQMRREDKPTGEPLNGIIVPIMENSFLIGLAQGEAEAPNLNLLRSRGWLDVPMVLANGRIAKLTFEKGESGQQALEDAITSWQGK